LGTKGGVPGLHEDRKDRRGGVNRGFTGTYPRTFLGRGGGGKVPRKKREKAFQAEKPEMRDETVTSEI